MQKIDGTKCLTNETTFAVDSVVFSTEFRHSKFVAYKVKDAIVDQMREKTGNRPNIRITNPDLQLHIHIAEYDCTLSLDSSGESLHRRGYRQSQVEAPLNEVLAAGIILMTGWNGETDFIDPMCGSGTFPIEAALIARNIAPGVFRKGYAFEKWPDFDQNLLDRIYNDDSREREFEHHIYGYDNNRQAVEIATGNVRAAGLSKDVDIIFKDFKDFTQPAEKSIIITNPPYGERISAPDLLGLYKMIGERLKHQFVGNEAWILSYREECFAQIGLKPSLKTPLYNGSLECELRKYQLFDGKYNEARAGGVEVKSSDDLKQMAQKRRFKQNRDFKKGLDEKDDKRSFEQRRRDALEEEMAEHGGHFRRDKRRDDGGRRPFRKDGDRSFRRDNRRDDDDRRSFRKDKGRDERREERRRMFGGDRSDRKPRRDNFKQNRFRDDD